MTYPSQITVRRATLKDASAVAILVETAYAPYLARMSRRPAPMDDDQRDVIASAEVWVAQDAGRIVGVVAVRRHDGHLLLENLAVDPCAQGQGIGALLLERVDEFATESGLFEILLYTNVAMTQNLAFYPRRGYVETHRAVDDGFERVFFLRTLPHR